MPFMRGCGSRPIVSIILVLLFVGAVCPTRLPVIIPPRISAPSCNARANSTVNATVIHADLIRRAAANLSAPQCNARANSTLNITVIEPDITRRAAENNLAPRCNARANSTINITVIQADVVRRTAASIHAPRCNARTNSTINTTVIQVERIRRADKSPGGQSGQSSGSGGSQGEHSGAPGALDLTPYIQKGQAVAAYLRASDEQIIADLVAKGKLKPAEQLASRFTDVSEFRSSGWDAMDGTPRLAQVFVEYVPFLAAFRSLGISSEARPRGNNERMVYEHIHPWVRDGRTMQPVGSNAEFQFVTNPQDACLVVTLAYSTQYQIRKQRLDLIHTENPPLSHKSDIAFLEWKRACTKYNTDPKSLKHIFISVILTDETQEVIGDILIHMGRRVNSWGDLWAKALPLWEQRLTFLPDSDEGKALLGTVQLKGIVWMLLQHREGLGKKTIKNISVFRDELTATTSAYDPDLRGPSIYVELEDMQ